MTSFSLLHRIIFFSTTGIGLWLSFWVYFAGRQKKVNNYFLLMVITWIFGETTPYFLFRNIPLSKNIILFLPRLTVASVFIFFIFFYFFVVHFLRDEKKFLALNKIVPSIAILGAILAIFTNLFQKSVMIKEGLGLDLILTIEGKIMWLGFVIALTLFISFRFLNSFFKSPQAERLKTQYFLIGLSCWIITNLIFNVYFPLIKDTFKYAYLGNYSIFILFGFTAFAIVKRQLFGMRVVLTQLLVALIGILLLVNFFVSQSTFEYIWKGVLFLAFVFFGWLLVKSVLREIKQKEELDRLATELAISNIRLEGAYKKLQKLDKAKSEFVSIASHQLRTPLTTIKGYVSMLLEGDYGKLPANAKLPLGSVYQSNERLIKLVNSLLNISRIEAGKMKLEFSEFSIEKFISGIIKDFKPKAKNKGLYLKFQKSKIKIPEVKADKNKLREVLSNLLDNAIKYTHTKGVTVKLDFKDKKLRIIIVDAGAGMTKGEISKLFQSFSRAGAGRKHWVEGAGLGLYVAKRFIEMHKGKIWAESPGKDKGSTFYIEIPVK